MGWMNDGFLRLVYCIAVAPAVVYFLAVLDPMALLLIMVIVYVVVEPVRVVVNFVVVLILRGIAGLVFRNRN
ncbi:hypothetical protein [Nioella sp. MMSF_3534]|uniref:hypothetical protein n=1 Tax=Nioella sp. MMSF_3534 TaxID=3046720 RepID=UPI00273D2DE4|nr:hypothetical protein [Nioella sp. MMSF_3534]